MNFLLLLKQNHVSEFFSFSTVFFQLEICDSDENAENSMSKDAKAAKTMTATLADELDNLMDISIEIASNKRMKKDYIKPFKLTFKDKDMEKKVRPRKNLNQVGTYHFFFYFIVWPSEGLHIQIQSFLCRWRLGSRFRQ